ncbi:MAG TPA: M20/M25/M40 family metallo-hydrolase, partial [Ardenticatenaceae bacterium]|nr:M20/M25/M40 family metallo-hydrolase [Ardenticatenaceae bacterium]
PAICIGYRGAFGLQIFVHGPRGDLHSGVYGGMIQNPIHALMEILGSLRDPQGRVLVAGFYDDVAPLSDDDRAQIAAVPFDHEQHAAQLGVAELFGEPGYTTLERAWARPTLEICGIWGGGRKPVIPHEARAFVTCRLAPNQEPERVATLVREHVEKQAPPGVEVSVRPPRTYIQPYLMPADHPGNRVAAAVLRQIYGREPYVLRNGASLPICDLFLRHLDAYTVSFGFGLEDENHHAPDEFLRLASFERGQRAYCMLFERFAEEGL